jgi:hypothetical protein
MNRCRARCRAAAGPGAGRWWRRLAGGRGHLAGRESRARRTARRPPGAGRRAAGGAAGAAPTTTTTRVSTRRRCTATRPRWPSRCSTKGGCDALGQRAGRRWWRRRGFQHGFRTVRSTATRLARLRHPRCRARRAGLRRRAARARARHPARAVLRGTCGRWRWRCRCWPWPLVGRAPRPAPLRRLGAAGVARSRRRCSR